MAGAAVCQPCRWSGSFHPWCRTHAIFGDLHAAHAGNRGYPFLSEPAEEMTQERIDHPLAEHVTRLDDGDLPTPLREELSQLASLDPAAYDDDPLADGHEVARKGPRCRRFEEPQEELQPPMQVSAVITLDLSMPVIWASAGAPPAATMTTSGFMFMMAAGSASFPSLTSTPSSSNCRP